MTGTEKYVDLDAHLAERRAARTPLKVKMFDREWELPSTPPAAVTVLVSRWFADGLVDPDTGEVLPGGAKAELTVAHYAMLLGEMVPQDIFDEWCSKGLETDDLEPTFEALMARYDMPELAGGQGNGNRAARRSPTSSPPGQRSKRTSTANTGSRTSGKS